MMTVLYRIIVGLTALLTVDALFRERGLPKKANAVLVLVPLVLRALMIV